MIIIDIIKYLCKWTFEFHFVRRTHLLRNITVKKNFKPYCYGQTYNTRSFCVGEEGY